MVEKVISIANLNVEGNLDRSAVKIELLFLPVVVQPLRIF